MMMMTSLMPYSPNPLALTSFSASGYNQTARYFSQSARPVIPNNCFPLFGNTPVFGGFGGHPSSCTQPQASYPTINPLGVGHLPIQQGDGWATVIQLVLSKLLHPAEKNVEVRQKKHPNVRVYSDTDYRTTEPKVIKPKKPALVTDTTKKAPLPQGVTPLSYNAIKNDSDYKKEAVAAVKEWQAHLTQYEHKLGNPSARKNWIKGAVTYLALLNDPKVRDEFMQQYPTTIGTYYNNVLRTLRENDDVRADMKGNSRNAPVLAIVDKTNKAIFEHRIFKNEA